MKGLEYVHDEDEIAPCPFCQQDTISKELLSQIKGYFDESYQNDIRSIETLLSNYQKRIEKGITQIEEPKKQSIYRGVYERNGDLFIQNCKGNN